MVCVDVLETKTYSEGGVRHQEILYPELNFSALVSTPLAAENPIIISGATKNYEGPTQFNHALFELGPSFLALQNSFVPEERRIKTDTDSVRVLSFTLPQIQRALDNLVMIVRLSDKRRPSRVQRLEYRNNIEICARAIQEHRDLPEAEANVVPLRGGALLAPGLGIEPSHIHALDCKRVPLSGARGHFALGMRTPAEGESPFITGYLPEEINGKHVRIIEVAIVTGMTTVAMLLDFYRQGIKPRFVEINAIGMSQQGVELIMKVAGKLGYHPNQLRFITAGLYYRTGDSYNNRGDEILTDNGNEAIGPASKFLNGEVEIS